MIYIILRKCPFAIWKLDITSISFRALISYFKLRKNGTKFIRARGNLITTWDVTIIIKNATSLLNAGGLANVSWFSHTDTQAYNPIQATESLCIWTWKQMLRANIISKIIGFRANQINMIFDGVALLLCHHVAS